MRTHALQEVGGDNMTRLSAQDIARLNKELSDLQPVVEALAQLRSKQEEVNDLHFLRPGLGVGMGVVVIGLVWGPNRLCV